MSFHRIHRPWAILTLFLLGAMLAASLAGAVSAAPPRQASPATHIVISEFRLLGPGGENDEFVELFNPTSTPIEITNWQIHGADNFGHTSPLFWILEPVVLAPGQHYLIANSGGYSGIVPADGTYPTGIPDDRGIALFAADGSTIIDQVGMGVGSAYGEGTRLTPLDIDGDQSYERGLGGGSGSCYDTDNNYADFAYLIPSDPQNRASPYTSCAAAATATPTPAAPAYVVISEFRTRGQGGTSDEFVELYNPTGAAVDIGNWTIRVSGGCSTSYSTLVSFPANTILQPGQHYLAAGDASSYVGIADRLFSSTIADDGGIALVTNRSAVVDQVGLCASTRYREGLTLTPLNVNADQSYERRPGGATSCYDLNSNAYDFVLISPALPQGRATPPTMCTGVSLWTPTGTATPTITRTPTQTRTPIPGVLIINEFLPHASTDWNADGLVDVGDEYIEIINRGTQSVTIYNWRLDDGDGGSNPYSLPDITLQPRQIIRFYGSQTGILLNDGGDSVRLLRPGGQIADAFTYPVVTAFDRTWCRYPDGDALWRFTCRPTPGRPNALAEITLGTATPAANVPPCPLPDSIPPDIRQAECADWNPGIWNPDFLGNGEVWLQGQDKWDIFVH
ncbi:MAG: lamin tail domain-containing protein [Anaerolineales bacterium]|nr:lamin tail domain-containing protein [Anaerolineales bacterium]